MTPKEIKILHQAALLAGLDASALQVANPFTKGGRQAEFLCAAVQEVDPVQAAQWRVEAGGGISLQAAAVLAGHAEPTPEVLENLYQHDPAFCRDELQRRKAKEADVMAKYEQAAEQGRLQRFMERTGGDEAKARHLLKTENEVHARQQAEQQGLKITHGAN